MIEFWSSSTWERVASLWSAVMVTKTSGGKTLSFASAMISLILSEASKRFSPALFTISRVTTGLAYSLA